MVVAAGAATIVMGTWAGVAAAITAGPYNPGQAGCPTYDNASTFNGVYPGCHSLQLLVQDGSGHTYAEAGTDQLPQNGENYHAGTLMVTPNGDGNVYGTQNGAPDGLQAQNSDTARQGTNGCPTASEYTAPDPGQTQTDVNNNVCPQPSQPGVTGPGVGTGFDTNYQPFPGYECGVEDIALYGAEWLLYVAGQSSHQCPLAPVRWDGPNTPLTYNGAQAAAPFDPTNFASPSPKWLNGAALEWHAPSAAPTFTPWVSAGTPNTNALALIMTGGQVYLAGDDNGDSGEHDGTDGQYSSGNTFNASSDGGAFILAWQPVSGAQTMASWTSLFTEAASEQSAAPLAPIAENPVPLANFGGGACADQICAGAYTSQRTLYSGGGGSGSQRDIYNYQEPNGSSKDWGPYNCNSGSAASEQACTTQPGSDGVTRSCPSGANDPNSTSCGMNYYKQQEASNVTTEPGVMVYADPDPQASPVAPLDPLPAAYVGTCGVVLGGGAPAAGQSPSVPAVPVLTSPAPALPSQLAPVAATNSAGQLVLADPTGC